MLAMWKHRTRACPIALCAGCRPHRERRLPATVNRFQLSLIDRQQGAASGDYLDFFALLHSACFTPRRKKK
jgi:hypothetical protein